LCQRGTTRRTKQYGESLPLADHEVVLTFDDGPLPPYTIRVLDIASECVKATFFWSGGWRGLTKTAVRQIVHVRPAQLHLPRTTRPGCPDTRATNQKQVPWDHSSLLGEVVLARQ
jgi:hypothetical protein